MSPSDIVRSRQELVMSSSAKKGACPMEDETSIGHTPGGDINVKDAPTNSPS